MSQSKIMNQLFSDMNKIFTDAGAKFEKPSRIKDEFISSEYCTECDGSGSIPGGWERGDDFVTPKEVYEQCAECEELHKQELRADRLHDEMKGN